MLKVTIFGGLSILAAVGIYYLNPDYLKFATLNYPKALMNLINSFYKSANFSSAYTLGPTFGLKMSLILTSFYAAQGLLPARPSLRRQRQKSSIVRPLLDRIPFHFMEIPVLLGLIVFGSALMPDSMILKYTGFLAGFGPVVPILESLAFMTVIMDAGRCWTLQITNSNNFIKICVILACFASFLASSAVFYFIYAQFRLSTLLASLISSIFTLTIVQIITCCQLDHATITDPALMFPYISYNLALIVLKGSIRAISAHQRDPQIYPKDPQMFLKLTEPFISPSPANYSLLRQILQTIFGPVLISHILLQLSLLTVAKNEEFNENESEDSSAFHKFRQFFVSTLWPRFGKSFLVVIYTISWLDQCHPEIVTTKAWYLNSFGLWRWISVFVCLAWYSKHLLFDSNLESPEKKTDYTCDKTFWKQFHNLKDE